jgi:predicted HicB family RNase H-like nuclease
MAQELEQNQYMKLIVRIPDELHKKLKVKAAQNGTTMTDLVVECLEKIVK